MDTFNDALVKGDLRVEGWLDAPNIRGFHKGLFPTIESLFAAYPRPLPGWAALVGSSLPADVYVASQSTWTATGGKGGMAGGTVSGADAVAVAAESEARLKFDSLMADTLSHALCWHLPSPEWNEGEYVSQANRRISARGYRRSAWIDLKPGDTIVFTCDSGGLAMPIAVEATDQPDGWWDLPMLGSDLSAGSRTYSFTAESATRVMLSCQGTPGEIFIFRNPGITPVTELRAINATPVSGSRRMYGALLHADGTREGTSGYGISRRRDLTHIARVRILTRMDAPDDSDHAFAIFYDGNGNILESHYCGKKLDGSMEYQTPALRATDLLATTPPPAISADPFPAEKAKEDGTPAATQSSGQPLPVHHPGGVIDMLLDVPAGTVAAEFAYCFPTPRKAANPPFRVELLP